MLRDWFGQKTQEPGFQTPLVRSQVFELLIQPIRRHIQHIFNLLALPQLLQERRCQRIVANLAHAVHDSVWVVPFAPQETPALCDFVLQLVLHLFAGLIQLLYQLSFWGERA